MIKCVQFLLVVLLAAVLFTGCGGEDTSGEEDAGGEEAASEAPIESLPSYDPGPDTDSETCQVGEAMSDLGPEGAQRLTDELLGEVSAGRFADMQEAYASRGYTCEGRAG